MTILYTENDKSFEQIFFLTELYILNILYFIFNRRYIQYIKKKIKRILGLAIFSFD